MSCPLDILQLMHKHLDHETSSEEDEHLKAHLQTCESCSKHLYEIEKSIALVKSTSHIEAPKDFTAAVMSKLPKEKQTVRWSRWLKNHPFLAAASLFIVLMTGSVISTWTEDHQFSVTPQPNLVVKNNIVTVPEGKVIHGDVTVKNGTLNIEGTVEGNVTVINGEKYMASAGQVTGDIEEIDEMFEWLWYHMKSLGQEVVSGVK
ncbi:anti-sigma-W factor RsiW [Metabacillus fastidiosus]|uniref:anti-sigma-W factor RsiW n=1 Tax=Metabacillus fastidiosus TaxID=1458 RepID=UPI002E23320C|nr:anti-sigma-W factor RsiW [Metabacillus fastidiosus]